MCCCEDLQDQSIQDSLTVLSNSIAYAFQQSFFPVGKVSVSQCTTCALVCITLYICDYCICAYIIMYVNLCIYAYILLKSKQ